MLHDDPTAAENLAFFGRLQGINGSSLRARITITEVLEAVGFAEDLRRRRSVPGQRRYAGGWGLPTATAESIDELVAVVMDGRTSITTRDLADALTIDCSRVKRAAEHADDCPSLAAPRRVVSALGEVHANSSLRSSRAGGGSLQFAHRQRRGLAASPSWRA